MTLSLVGGSELRLDHKVWARVVSVRDTGTVSILRQEGGRNCGTSTAHRAPFRIWWGQSSGHSPPQDEWRGQVCGDRHMLRATHDVPGGAEFLERKGDPRSLLGGV